MTQNRLLHVALTTFVILSVLMGAIAGPIVAPSSEAQPATTGENGTTVNDNPDTTADTTTNAPVIGVNDTNTNANANDLTNTNTNTNTNRANASAGARSTGSTLDADGNGGNGSNGGNGTTGCTLPPPGTDAFEELQKFLPENDSAGDQFGRSVAIDWANETIVVGAPADTNENGNNAGAVYVFSCQGDQFVRTQKLTASDGQVGDDFGSSVTIDGGSIVVGSRLDTENGSETGAAYVFERQGGSFVETQKLLASDGQAGDRFGSSVAIAGDTIVVGARLGTENGSETGAAYVYERQGGQFVETQKLLASDGAAFDNFGISVAIDGEIQTIVVGARDDDNTNGNNAGAAYVFERQGGSFVETQKLLASAGNQSDNFGYSVAIDEETQTIVVGAVNGDNENGVGAGAAYVFERQGGQFVETQKLFASDGQGGDDFGVSVAIDGETIVAGSSLDNNANGAGAGAAYVFERQGSSFVETQKLLASDGAAADNFGLSVAIDGWIVGGAPLNDNENGDDAGAGYVFD